MSATGKAVERGFVERAARHFGWNASITDHESPDFELRFPDKTIVGLEVTQTVEEGMAEGRPAMRRLCQDVESRLAKIGYCADVSLSFFWACAELVAPKEVRQGHAAAIAGMISNKAPPRRRRTIGEQALTAAGAPYVKNVLVFPSDELNVDWGHHGPGPTFPFLDQRIKEKDLLLDGYRKRMSHAESFWLLLVSSAHPAGGMLADVVRNHVYPTHFDRVLFLDVYDDLAFEVRTTPRQE